MLLWGGCSLGGWHAPTLPIWGTFVLCGVQVSRMLPDSAAVVAFSCSYRCDGAPTLSLTRGARGAQSMGQAWQVPGLQGSYLYLVGSAGQGMYQAVFMSATSVRCHCSAALSGCDGGGNCRHR